MRTPSPTTLAPTPHLVQQLFVNVKAGFADKSLPTIRAGLDACLVALEDLGVDFRVCVFEASDGLPDIQRVASIGHHLTQLRRYFSGLSLATTSWSQWRISWSSTQGNAYTESNFLQDINAVAEPFKMLFYRKRLQAPFTTTVGWIFKTFDRTNCNDLQEFLTHELALMGFRSPFALYLKVPFAGAPLPPDRAPSSRSSLAVHVDTITGHHKLLYQKLKLLLKSNRLARYTNWKWKLFPTFQRDLDPSDQKELLKVMAKQKLMKQSIATLTLNTVLDLDARLCDTTVRSFLLSHRTGLRSTILGIDRDPTSLSTFTITASVSLRAEAFQLVQFIPISLVQTFGPAGQAALSEEGVFLLEDQYWDSSTDQPRSRFSDDLRADHETDEGDIVIILANLPSDLLEEGARPAVTPFPMDTDNMTHASFNTLGQSKPTASMSVTPVATTIPVAWTPSPSLPAGALPVVVPPGGVPLSDKDREIPCLRLQLANTLGSGEALARPNEGS